MSALAQQSFNVKAAAPRADLISCCPLLGFLCQNFDVLWPIVCKLGLSIGASKLTIPSAPNQRALTPRLPLKKRPATVTQTSPAEVSINVKISTIVLNWNRSVLLEQTLRSYLATVSGPWHLTVVDNASTDHSLQVIQRYRQQLSDIEVISLNENLGGEALNLALPTIQQGLVHFCENDEAFLPGWSDYARQCFAAFPNLGQLSLHGVTPTDDEAWIPKPGGLRFAQGIIIYEATENVGTSSIIPVHVFDKHGVRVHNLAPNAALAGCAFRSTSPPGCGLASCAAVSVSSHAATLAGITALPFSHPSTVSSLTRRTRASAAVDQCRD
jgi:hypothetical protein